MATTIHSKIGMWYYYPLKGNHDGQHEKDAECWSAVRREIRENELAEWVLVDAVSKDWRKKGRHSRKSRCEVHLHQKLIVCHSSYGCCSLASQILACFSLLQRAPTLDCSLVYSQEVPSRALQESLNRQLMISWSLDLIMEGELYLLLWDPIRYDLAPLDFQSSPAWFQPSLSLSSLVSPIFLPSLQEHRYSLRTIQWNSRSSSSWILSKCQIYFNQLRTFSKTT